MNSQQVNIDNVSIKVANLNDLVNDINYFAEKEGIVLKNVMFPINECIYIPLINNGQTRIECGKIIDNLYLFSESNQENYIYIYDFDEIERVSEDFCKSFTKLLLQSKSKIITINMNAAISATFSQFIEKNLRETEE